ncbi:sensor histidine kinase [Actinokineospora bangkokensis]|uniref:histidine kinase n=1 Tax=Actinokineospora bangkokensis TaxID=1193682 RepID=A0A1Q9LG58_9PSEU|nr:histidine kinase [Actinokineospora bangkokensis]OLR91000.1 two-component sensor histidine kinase [Actinokineospora bangkokensis]
MRRLSLWFKAHPTAGDVVLVLVLAAFEFIAGAARIPTGVAEPWYWVVGAGLLLPLVVRRRKPVLSAYCVLGAGFVQLVTHAYPGARFADLALGISLYTLVAYATRRHGGLYAVWLAIGTVVWALLRLQGFNGVFVVAVYAVIFALCWTLGEFSGARRAYQLEVERRLELLETERGQQARIAVADERTRIARELHDVVAHAVSVIVVQADGAAYAVRGAPETAEQALATISATGREALTELRRLLGVLRSEHGESDRAPQPGAQSLADLAERVRGTGVPVELELSGGLDALPAGVGLGVYRIVQEALTNTIKHAGPGARARVRVRRGGDQVELEVLDEGAGRSRVVAPGSGNGLIGMRERANVFGGTLSAGPRPEGGWRVHAVLPVAEG